MPDQQGRMDDREFLQHVISVVAVVQEDEIDVLFILDESAEECDAVLQVEVDVVTDPGQISVILRKPLDVLIDLDRTRGYTRPRWSCRKRPSTITAFGAGASPRVRSEGGIGSTLLSSASAVSTEVLPASFGPTSAISFPSRLMRTRSRNRL
jgi:hypothetical protein